MAKKFLLLLAFVNFSFAIAFAQERVITGKVTDAKETLIGVSISILGTDKGTQTDVNGMYSIKAKTGQTLVFSYLGYKTKQVKLGDQKTLNVNLESDALMLNEVVAIGYGTVKKKDLTGAVASVSADVIAAQPVSSALQAIQGRVSGVQISSTEGSPDAEMTVRVRGGGSITGDNTPLYIVDGFPVNSISDIAPQDIESIDILKDASSTAIYGSRGANGVVLVTTKSGKEGKTAISINAFGGIRNITKTLDVLTPKDYVTWQYERALLSNDLDKYTAYFGNYQDIDLYDKVVANDWQNIIFGRTGNTYNQNISISGGGEKTKYNLSHSLVKDKAIMLGSGYQRQNLNFKLNHKLYDKLTLDFGIRYADTKTDGAGANEQNENVKDTRLKNAVIYPPFPVSNLIDNEITDDKFNLYNPLVSVYDNDKFAHRKTYNFNGALNYEIVKNLKLRSAVGYDGYRDDQDRFYGTTTYYAKNNVESFSGTPAVTFSNTQRNAIRNTNTLTYDFKKLINKNHNLNLLVGQEYFKTQESTDVTQINGFLPTFSFADTRYLSGQGKASKGAKSFSPDDILLSFFSRANYDFKGRYLLSATFRADGSSKFMESNRWGYFPSVSGAWRVSGEDFMTWSKDWLDDLKLRASYGTAGNNNIPSGQTVPLLEPNGPTTAVYTNGYTNFLAPSKIMANPDLKWETTVTQNLGLDFSLLNSKITGTAEVYLNKTKDLLILFPVGGTGYDYQYRNLGETQNKGLELSLNWSAIRKDNFDLNVNANISFNRNRVNSIGGLDNIVGNSDWASTEIQDDYKVEVGQSVGRIYGYVSDGRYEVSDFEPYNGTSWVLKSGVADVTPVVGSPRPGSMKLKNIYDEKDGKTLVNASDRTIIGDANPLHTGGFSISSRIYNFDIAAYFNWSYGNDVYNANKIEYTSTSQYNSRNMIDIMASGNRWTNLKADGTISNDAAELEAMNANTTMWSPYMSRYIISDWAVEDGSFLRLGTITLGYTLPKTISSKLKMKSARIYASGYNLLLFTNYSGFDPEVSTRRKNPLTPGVDYSAYPKSKMYVIGLDINF
ncbi:SusC/RagA family protein [Pelobium manganitolerans]|uniref:SusC/RagA family protein n=1 Tax=Pelobium manganitolerans TaxID=1842495 RepID=A0A419SB98_9SPHI|nr:TonB-dependent receptor [Pelobium manganitolerans]RKD20102.1 SusC/RagA family protein [Pelobium manganitolerans]